MNEIYFLIIFATQITIFYKLKKILMSAESKLDELLAEIGDVATLLENAFQGTGDLTESEVTAKVQPILDRLRAIVPAP